VRAEVTADLDFTATEQTRESFNPDLPAVRSERSLEEERTGGGTGGVPGALSNAPPGEATAPEQVNPPAAGANPAAPGAAAQTQAKAAAPTTKRNETTRNYEVDRTISHTDSVSVVNQGFHPTAAPEIPEMDKVPLWEQPMVRDLAKLLSGLITVSLLLLFVVRPLIRNLTTGGAPPRARLAVAGTAGELPAVAEGGPVPESGAQVVGGVPVPAAAAGAGYDQQIAMARSHVTKDPARVAQVVKDWVQADD